MRVSTNLFHVTSFNGIHGHQRELLDIQEKLSTGKQVNKPSDDPVGQTLIHTLNRTMNTLDQYAKNGDYAKTQLVLQETAVSDTITVVQRVRELGLQMMNGTYNPDQRRHAAAEVGQLLMHVKNNMNLKNSEGQYIFTGNNVNTTPFVDDPQNPGYITYVGNEQVLGVDHVPESNFGGRFVQIGFDHRDRLEPDDEYNMSRVRISDTGSTVYGFEANNYQVQSLTQDARLNQPVDDNIYNVMRLLEQQLLDGEKPTPEVIEDLKNGITNLSNVLSSVGGRFNRIETQYDAGQEFKLAVTEHKMKIEEQDLVEGISKFTVTQNALQMAQQVFSKVQGMSLFDYIR
jgi:flagellar hook-associated protein 3 FlgL